MHMHGMLFISTRYCPIFYSFSNEEGWVLLSMHLSCNQHFAGCTGYGHDEAGGREALDQAFAEIVGAESAIVRSQVCYMLPLYFGYYEFLVFTMNSC